MLHLDGFVVEGAVNCVERLGRDTVIAIDRKRGYVSAAVAGFEHVC